MKQLYVEHIHYEEVKSDSSFKVKSHQGGV